MKKTITILVIIIILGGVALLGYNSFFGKPAQLKKLEKSIEDFNDRQGSFELQDEFTGPNTNKPLQVNTITE